MSRVLWILSVLALAAGGAWAQVGLTQSGHALDANYRVGSGGLNGPILVDQGGLSSQLYVTGEVTGGASFRGPVPYFAADHIDLILPSQAISNFNRDSMGLPSVMAGQTAGPTAYYSPSTTVYGIGGIVQGLTAPGTNAPPTSETLRSAMESRLYINTIQDYRPLVISPLATNIEVVGPGEAAPLLLSQVLLGVPQAQPEPSVLFGVLSSEQQQRLAEQLSAEMAAEAQFAIPRPADGTRAGDPRCPTCRSRRSPRPSRPPGAADPRFARRRRRRRRRDPADLPRRAHPRARAGRVPGHHVPPVATAPGSHTGRGPSRPGAELWPDAGPKHRPTPPGAGPDRPTHYRAGQILHRQHLGRHQPRHVQPVDGPADRHSTRASSTRPPPAIPSPATSSRPTR